MKLKTYNTQNTHSARIGDPYVRVYGKAGAFIFSTGLCRETGWKSGDAFLFHQDENRPQDWYIEKTNAEEGFIGRINQGGGGSPFSLTFQQFYFMPGDTLQPGHSDKAGRCMRC